MSEPPFYQNCPDGLNLPDGLNIPSRPVTLGIQPRAQGRRSSLARRKGLIRPVKVPTPLRAGGFRDLRGTPIDPSESQRLQPVTASISRRERFRSQAVKDSQSSTFD